MIRRVCLATLTLLPVVFVLHHLENRRSAIAPPVRFFQPEFDQRVKREPNAPAIHEYSIEMAQAEALRWTITQHGLDLSVELFDPTDELLLTVEGTNTVASLPELQCLIARISGPHLLRVHTLGADAAGFYDLWLMRPSAATRQDQKCEEASLARDTAETINTPDSLGGELEKALEVNDLWASTDLFYPRAIAQYRVAWLQQSTGALQDAARSYQEALTLFRTLGDRKLLADVYTRLGLVERRLGELDQAGAHLRKALEIALEIAEPGGITSGLNHLGRLEQARGHHHAAIDHFEQALTLTSHLSDPRERATLLFNLGVSQSRLGRSSEALTTLADAADSWPRALPPQEARVRVADTAIEIGWIHHLLDDSSSALPFLEGALQTYQEAEDRLREAVALDRLGTVLRRSKEYAAALLVYRRSQRILTDLEEARNLASTRANIGWALEDLGQSLLAERELQPALEAFQSTRDLASEAHTLAGLAQVHRSLGHLDLARQEIELALQRVEELQVTGRVHGERLRTYPIWHDYYDLYIQLLMELDARDPSAGYDRRALEISDAMRRRDLLDILLESRIPLPENLDGRLGERQAVVLERLAELEYRAQRLQHTVPGAGHQPLDATLENQFRELRKVQRSIRAQNPQYLALRHPEPLTILEMQELLPEDSVMLSFVLGRWSSHLFWVTPTEFEAHPLPPREELERAARAFWRGVSGPRSGITLSQVDGVGRSLSRSLLGPIADRLKDQRLIVVGDGILHYLPFSALPHPAATWSGQRMIDHHELSYLPSVAVIDLLRERAKSRPKSRRMMAILADPSFEAIEVLERQDDSASFSFDGGRRFASLPHTRREAEAILRNLQGSDFMLALGSDARASLVEEGALSNYEILHFATHGLFDEQFPERSGIALAMVDPQGNPTDGFLSLTEIYQANLPAELVVLSGCSTALGEFVRGAGLVGLTRGFFYAGATRLLVSLWAVDDEATAELMGYFYESLLGYRQQPAAALRSAQQRLRSDPRWVAPYYWAGFVLQGDFEGISRDRLR